MYNNFIEFPSNYFQGSDFVLDEINKRVKLKFSGKLYQDITSLTSDYRMIEGEIDMEYIDNGNEPSIIVVNGIEQYCRANFNGNPWSARFERSYSSFTNEFEYKIETHFSASSIPGNYSFNSSSIDNYVRLSKYNPLTNTYDYYLVNGEVGYTYKETHGGNRFSYIGTFSFDATNPNNPTDIIQVTNGVFRSYQQF